MSRHFRSAVLSLLVLALAFALVPVSAQVYDAAKDFSATTNPNASWQYGWSSDRLSPFNLYQQTTDGGTNGELAFWHDTALGLVPSVFRNQTGSMYNAGTLSFQPGELVLHPGSIGQYSHVEWTATTAGIFNLDTTFTGVDVGSTSPFGQNGTTTDVHILKNGVSLFDGSISGYLATASYSQILSVSPGDTIDFAVGYGNGHYDDDSTGLSATIRPTAVPEPGALALLTGAVVFGGGLLARCRR